MKSQHRPEIHIYTDGAAVPNPGPGGWAAILLGKKTSGDSIEKTISGSEAFTTSTRMELKAAVEALSALKQPCRVLIYSDSRYLCNGANTWLPIWKSHNWQANSGERIKNLDLWQQLDVLMQTHQVQCQWVKGHADNELNMRVDQLAHGKISHPELPLSVREVYHLFVGVTCTSKRGAWGVVLRKDAEQFEYGGYQPVSTNNQLELQALIDVLQKLPETEKVYVYTKNNYILSAVQHDIAHWKETNWYTSTGRPVKNRDLWETLLKLQSNRNVSWFLAKDKEIKEFLVAQGIARKQLDEHDEQKS